MILGKRVDDVDAAMKRMEATRDDKNEDAGFRHKDAKDVKPGHWEESGSFLDLMLELRTWASAFHEDYDELMDRTEKNLKEYITEDNVDMITYPDFKKMDKYLWQMLIVSVKGNAKTFIKNPRDSGFQAWA